MASQFDPEKSLLLISLANLERSEVQRQANERAQAWRFSLMTTALTVAVSGLAILLAGGLQVSSGITVAAVILIGGSLTATTLWVTLVTRRQSGSLLEDAERRDAILARYLRESGHAQQLIELDSSTARLATDLGLLEFRDRWSPSPAGLDSERRPGGGPAGLRVIYGERMYRQAIVELWANNLFPHCGFLISTTTNTLLSLRSHWSTWPDNTQVLLRYGGRDREMELELNEALRASDLDVRWDDRATVSLDVAVYGLAEEFADLRALLTLAGPDQSVTVALRVDPKENPRLRSLLSDLSQEFNRAWMLSAGNPLPPGSRL